MADEKKLYEVCDGESHWIVATSADEALQIARDVYEFGAFEDEEEMTCEVVPGDRPFTVTFGDDTPETVKDYSLPPEASIDGVAVTATAAEWAGFEKVGSLVATTCC